MTSKPLRMLALLFGMILTTSCAIRPTPAQQAADSPVKAVPCVELPVMRFHAPGTLPEAKAWAAGTLPDPLNIYDTPETVTAVRKANAAREAVCGP